MKTDSPFTRPWVSQLHDCWLQIAVPNFLESIGINFNTSFFEALSACSQTEDPYTNSIWKIIPHSVIPAGVLHCYPKKVESSRVNWEEWFLLNGEIHHHILSNFTFASEQGTWTPEADDQDHPVEVLGLTWHYENLTDFRPALFTQSGV